MPCCKLNILRKRNRTRRCVSEFFQRALGRGQRRMPLSPAIRNPHLQPATRTWTRNPQPATRARNGHPLSHLQPVPATRTCTRNPRPQPAPATRFRSLQPATCNLHPATCKVHQQLAPAIAAPAPATRTRNPHQEIYRLEEIEDNKPTPNICCCCPGPCCCTRFVFGCK